MEEVAGQDNLDATERAWITAYFAADLVDHVEQPGVQHGNLVNDEDVRSLNLAFASGFDEFEQAGAQGGGHADAAPRMDGLAVDMRGGDACGRGDCHTGAVGPSLADELVQDIGLTGTGRTGQEHVRAGVQNGQGFGLAHINLSRLPSGRGAKYGGLLIEDAGGYDVGGDGLGCGIVRTGGGGHEGLAVVA